MFELTSTYLISLLVSLSCELGKIMIRYDILGAGRVIRIKSNQIYSVLYKSDDHCSNRLQLDLVSRLVNFSCDFAGNRPNHALWMVRYHFNLLNVDPGVRRILENGALSIRRTGKDFSRTPVDLTLEQTINADTASRLTGFFSFI